MPEPGSLKLTEQNVQLPVIQSLWVGTRLSSMEQLCVTSFLANGHPFHLYAYNEIEALPDGVELKDANNILPEDSIFKYRDRNSYAGFSNIFRYKLLLEKGSIWTDMDVVCIDAFNLSNDYVFATERDHTSQAHITSCVIKVPQNSMLMEQCYLESKQLDPIDIKWGMIGPNFLGQRVKKMGLEKYAVDPDVFCPINWMDFQTLINKEHPPMKKNRVGNIKAIHLWNEMWRIHGIDKNAQFSPDCIYEQFKAVYSVS